MVASIVDSVKKMDCPHYITKIIEYWSPSGSSILYKRICKRCGENLK